MERSIQGSLRSEYILYAGLVCIRICLALSPQTGYIHPDEYFQSLEVVIGDVYKTERSKVWEFDDEFPIRNAFIPYLLYGIPCFVVKQVLQFFNFFGPVSPYFLVIPPRLVLCLLSFLVDFSLAKICQLYKTDVGGRLVLLGSSCVMLVFGTRTFSNTVEMILFSLLLHVIVKSIIESEKIYPIEDKLLESLEAATNARDKVLINRQLKELSHHTNGGFWEIALLTVFGMFNRPTFMAFAIGPIFFWLYRGAPMRKIKISTVHMRMFYLVIVGFPMALLMIAADTMYYKRDKALQIIIHKGFGECFNQFVECLEITPLNFLRYNFHVENLAKHGLHPRYLHLMVNIPLLYNVLGISVFYVIMTTFFKILRRKFSNMPNFDSVTGLMFGSIIIPMTVLSLAPHQEPRFLIPLTVPLIFLKGMKMNNKTEDKDYCFRSLFGNRFSKKIIYIWYFCNVVFAYFFGFLHQSGVLPAINYLNGVRNVIKNNAQIHVIPSYTYTLPKSLLSATIYDGKSWKPSKSKVVLYPSTSTNFESSMRLLEAVVKNVETEASYDNLVYFIFPTSLTRNFTSHHILKRLNVRYIVEYYHLLHMSTEALPKFRRFFNEIGLNVVLLRSEKFVEQHDQDSFSSYFVPRDNPTFKELFTHF